MDDGAQKILDQIVLLQDAPFRKLEQNLAEYREHTRHGVGLLDAKTATLLHYTATLCRYAASRIKCEPDNAIEPIVSALVKDWVVLERIRPLEKSLRPRLLTLLERADRLNSNKNSTPEKMPRARPDPSSLVIDDDQENNENCVSAGDAEGDVERYRPPKIAEVVYDGEPEVIFAKEAKARERLAARLARSTNVREMLAEVSGRPEEVRDVDDEGDGFADQEMARLRREEEDRIRYEEENFVRLNVTRDDKRRRRALNHAAERKDSLSGSMGDTFSDLVDVADRVIGKGKQKGGFAKSARDRSTILASETDRGRTTRERTKVGNSRRKRRKQ